MLTELIVKKSKSSI